MAPEIGYEHWDGSEWITDATAIVTGVVHQVDSTLYVPDDQLETLDSTLLPHQVTVKKDVYGKVYSRSGTMQEISVASSGFILRKVKALSELPYNPSK
ncbi:MAG: hypothetical protein WCG44_04410 [bacterium]